MYTHIAPYVYIYIQICVWAHVCYLYDLHNQMACQWHLDTSPSLSPHGGHLEKVPCDLRISLAGYALPLASPDPHGSWNQSFFTRCSAWRTQFTSDPRHVYIYVHNHPCSWSIGVHIKYGLHHPDQLIINGLTWRICGLVTLSDSESLANWGDPPRICLERSQRCCYRDTSNTFTPGNWGAITNILTTSKVS